jgi:ABC-2 type transport system permease protein
MAVVCVAAVRALAFVEDEQFRYAGPPTVASSVFAPADSMADGVRQFAEANRFTTISDAVPVAVVDIPASTDVWMAFVWCFVLIAVFGPIAVTRYRHVTAS